MKERELELLRSLEKYLPQAAVPWALAKMKQHGIHLRITGYRQSKLGDYRPPRPGEPHRISINHHLNPQAFVITFVHEVAHLEVFLKHGKGVAPHGPEWQEHYARLLYEMCRLGALEAEIRHYLESRGFRHGASSCSDPTLLRLLRHYDRPIHPEVVLLEEVPEGAVFVLANGRLFRKGPLKRQRFLCRCLKTGKDYLIHHLTEVRPFPSAS